MSLSFKMLRRIAGPARRALFPEPPQKAFTGPWYRRHTQRRQEHLASLGLPIAGRSVLEVGAGIGDHTTFFLDRGCTVLATDARRENLAVLARHHPEVEIALLDLDNADPKDSIAPRDIVYCYGTLYHLSEPAAAIEYLAAKSCGLLLLETCVSPDAEESLNPIAEKRRNVTQAASGTGCRPTRLWVRNRLAEHFPHVYLTRTQPWHPEFPSDWREAASSPHLTRCVFVGSRTELHLDTLTTDIPEVQVRH